jgi:hypothetical protein
MRKKFARFGSVRLAGVALALLVPWLGVQLYYTAQFVPVAVGLQSREVFLERYVALYRDFVALDRILPADAVILADERIGLVYSPRRTYVDLADVPAGRPVYALIQPEPASDSASPRVPGSISGEVVYRNGHATVETYRTPGRASLTGPIEVVRLVPR